MGTLPDVHLGAGLFHWLAPGAGAGWRHTPPSVTVTGATARDGRRVRFAHNWSWEPATIRLPGGVHDLSTGRDHRPGETLTLGAWDVRVLVEAAAPAR